MPISKLEFPEALELAETASIFQDLEFVIKSTRALSSMLNEGSKDEVVLRGLFTAALVIYIRCFTSGKRISLTSDIYKSLPGEPIICHQQYKDTRDKHIAHSVNACEEMIIGATLSPENSPNREVTGLAYLTSSLTAYDINGIEQLGRLAEFAQQYIVEKQKVLGEQVFSIAKNIDIETLYKGNKLRITPKGGPASCNPKKYLIHGVSRLIAFYAIYHIEPWQSDISENLL
ncbi:hypothetical protein ICN34_08505 [Polynucleobacter sp. Tro8-14-1]|nr:hypothetical protein [Polynucleobacter sp. Tro8-14-1]